ncbi:hypothetical protein TSUD_262400 [Trifolium subterraneum]|nr:hypothetical protein TSUD_262400 [Trifolium subterraneum]
MVVVDTTPFWRLEEENNGYVKLQRVMKNRGMGRCCINEKDKLFLIWWGPFPAKKYIQTI